MHERIIEIIAHVIAQMREVPNLNDVVVDELSAQGYTPTEISTAFSWLIDRMEFADQVISNDDIANTVSFRILDHRERSSLGAETFGYLLQMLQLGLISNEHLEILIDRLTADEDHDLSGAELKAAIASVVFNADGDYMSGSRMLLNGDDTIH